MIEKILGLGQQKGGTPNWAWCWTGAVECRKKAPVFTSGEMCLWEGQGFLTEQANWLVDLNNSH